MQKTPFELNPSTSSTYAECIAYYSSLAEEHPSFISMKVAGSTDIGEPIHTVILSYDGHFDPSEIRRSGKSILMINNGIHPGEPDGIDACMMLARDIIIDPSKRELLKNVTILIIPVFNIDGCLNRNSSSRVNQEGPESYGFRGNSRNYDLNRDFIKCDTKNAKSFAQIFAHYKPDVLIDTHTSNGADYQYTMTLIATQHDKLPTPLAEYLTKALLPAVYADMSSCGWPMTPYVNVDDGQIPDDGILGFLDHPRYSSGFASLFHCLSFVPETHMLKPFESRVLSTYAFIDVMLRFIDRDHIALVDARRRAEAETASRCSFPLQWISDESRWDEITFLGFEAGYKKSLVSGLDRLFYDRSKPFTKTIKYFNYYLPTLSVNKPAAYIIPKAYEGIVHLLLLNGIQVQKLTAAATILEVEQYYIESYKSRHEPYEGHHLNFDVLVRTVLKTNVPLSSGDFLIRTGSPMDRYIIETLEPQGADSFFAWNFFDAILQWKETFSSYVFEDLAAEYLKSHPEVQALLEAKRQSDPEFASSSRAQLEFVYRHSHWYEPTHMAYPILRLKENASEDISRILLPLSP